MNGPAYQLVTLGARYLFIFLAFLIVFRAGLSLLKEHRRRKKKLHNLPDAGMVGEMRDIDNDRAYPLPREGTLGSGRGCDIRLKGLRRRHVNFSFVEGKGLLLTPCHGRSEVMLNNEPIRKGGYALHGALMEAGAYTLRIRLFAGLNVPRAAQYTERWQPVYDEELYAPDPMAGMTMQQPYLPPFPGGEDYSQPENEYSENDLYDYAPPAQPMYTQPPAYVQQPPYTPPVYQTPPVRPVYQAPPEDEDQDAPLPFDTGMYAPAQPQEEDLLLIAPRVRHRRSERNKRP